MPVENGWSSDAWATLDLGDRVGTCRLHLAHLSNRYGGN
jgi:hypothetical protein